MCVCCGNTNEKILFIKNGYTLARCFNCDLIYVKNLPYTEELKKFYSSDYFSRGRGDGIGYRNYLQDEMINRFNARVLLNKIQKNKKTGNLLDIGCGYGFFLDEAKKMGWNIWGVDISKEAYAYAREKLKLNVYNCDLLESEFNNDFFDAIFLSGSFEHLSSPFSALKEIRRISKKNALLFISTLNRNWPFWFFGLFQYKPPEHLFYFSEKSIRSLLDKAGFCIEKITPYWKYYSIYDLAWRSKEFLFGSTDLFNFLLNRKSLQHIRMKIPTNEMIILAKKP